ncbi:MAG: hypothetical protein K9L24_03635 [Spirochaetia bacterium]|nr:hypothetical protein [Spirochaetia bacterium]
MNKSVKISIVQTAVKTGLQPVIPTAVPVIGKTARRIRRAERETPRLLGTSITFGGRN